MRESFPDQLRFDMPAITEVSFDLECRDSMVPVLRSLQHVFANQPLRDSILELIEGDINENSQSDVGRNGMGYWELLVLAGVKLGCNLTYDQLHDLSGNHRRLRAIMGIGPWDESTSFKWRRIRDNLCLLKSSTIDGISHLLVEAGHQLVPGAAATARADSFVVETAVHYPTESTLIRDGVRKIIDLCVPLAATAGLTGWRQHEHLWKQVKRSSRVIERIAARKGQNYKQRLKTAYRKLLKQSTRAVRRARELLVQLELPAPAEDDIYGKHSLQAFIARTERVQDTADRRVLKGETVPHEEKLFSMFEPHTQLYKRGKAGQPVQFGRLVLIYEDGFGFITHHHVLGRHKGDADVVVEQTRIVQDRLGGQIQRVSFDRGFHSPWNQEQLAKCVETVCLPKPGKNQSVEQHAAASDEFHAGVQNHPGVESTIGALQSGNGLERCRDKSELGFERYVSLGIFGRNLFTLGRALIAAESPMSLAGQSRRAA